MQDYYTHHTSDNKNDIICIEKNFRMLKYVAIELTIKVFKSCSIIWSSLGLKSELMQDYKCSDYDTQTNSFWPVKLLAQPADRIETELFDNLQFNVLEA